MAGGFGTRLSEETAVRPKPMVEIGDQPILWHILKTYSRHGINEFIICAGYKGHMITEWFANYRLRTADVTFDLADNSFELIDRAAESDVALDSGRRPKQRNSKHLSQRDSSMLFANRAIVLARRRRAKRSPLRSVRSSPLAARFVASDVIYSVDKARARMVRSGPIQEEMSGIMGRQ